MPRFAAIRTLDGAEVIDADTGRTLAVRSSFRSANGTVQELISAGEHWPSVLCSRRASFHAEDAAALVSDPSDPSGASLLDPAGIAGVRFREGLEG